MGYAPTYFPGTTSVTDARRVAVSLGQEVSNTDLALIPGRAVSVSGIAMIPSVVRWPADVGLMQQLKGPGTIMMFSGSPSVRRRRRTFMLKNVPPGEYLVQAQSSVESGGRAVPEAAVAPIIVNGGGCR